MGEYLPSLIMLCVLYGIPFSLGWWFLVFIPLCINRGKIQQAANPAQTPDSCMNCLLAWCCDPCIICQEARTIDKAKFSGGVVGQAVAYGQAVVGQVVQATNKN